MATALAGTLIKASTKVPLTNIVIEIRDTTTGTTIATATTDAYGYFGATGLAETTTYYAAPRVTGQDWDISLQAADAPAPDDPQWCFTTEFAETSGVPPVQAWFDGVAAMGFHGMGFAMHNLSQTGANPYASTVIDRVIAAGMWAYGYYRPVEHMLDVGYAALDTAHQDALIMIQLDVEDVGHLVTHTHVTDAEATGRLVTIYTNWGLFGDVMGYGATGWSDVPLHMRDIYTVPATLITQVPSDMYTAYPGKLFESWDNVPRLMPADWTTRIGVQWADPIALTVSATTYDATINVFSASFLGIPGAGVNALQAHTHSNEDTGGGALTPVTIDTTGDVTIAGDLSQPATSGARHRYMGSADGSTGEGLEEYYDFSTSTYALQGIEHGVEYKHLIMTFLDFVMNTGSTGNAANFRVDENGRVRIYFTSSSSPSSRGLYLGTIDSAHTNASEGLEIRYDYSTDTVYFETAEYGAHYNHFYFKGLDAIFNMGTASPAGTGDILKIDQNGISFKTQGATNYMLLAKAADGGARTVTFPDATGTVDLIAEAQTLSNKIISATGTTIPAIIMPNFQGNGAGTQTTSSTTQLNIQTVTITNPTVAGQIQVTALVGLFGATVAADTFQVKLWIGTTPTEVARATWVAHATDLRGNITLVGAAAVANSGTQLIRISVTRTAGTGTVSVIGDGVQTGLSWIIVPGAGTTA